MELTHGEQSELNKLIENYKKIEPFILKHPRLLYAEFDYLIVHELTLFTVEPDFSFEELDSELNVILNALPAIRRIFAQPCIHLKEQNEILPTESVRIINHNTIQHIASHSELWSNVKKHEIKPTKLLTKTYDDNYGIYENLVFCKTVDEVLSYARYNLRILKELIYTNQSIEINLLERVNHLNYFLALGKLHTGYSRNFDSYYGVSVQCLNKLQYIVGSIVPRLKRPVYKNNKNRPQKIRLRKTNILSMHREYHQIYKLAKHFAAHEISNVKEIKESDLKKLQSNYFHFCELLSIFAVTHFNFSYGILPVNFLRLNMIFSFKGWRLTLKKCKCGNFDALALCVEKENKYTAAIIPSAFKDNEKLLEEIKRGVPADEYDIFTPFEEHGENEVPVSITNIDSFRRIQQIILRAMIYADKTRTDCPFCNNKLILDGNVYKCLSCRTEIHTGRCPTKKKSYQFTKIAGLNKQPLDGEDWLVERKKEAQMYFRNITKINEDMEIICPHCGKIHE
ncbi:MAG: hypothetical protein K2N52_01980 [Clostridia bacterium]|nr:hypothetical protein [Clostridia bacterium]